MNKSIGSLCPESDSLHYSFWIPAYQRGYRWTPTEVEDLLRDIDDCYTNNKNPDEPIYCLQPLIVKKGTDPDDPEKTRWEVIDGQQRLTTIYLILCALYNAGGDIDNLFDIETERKTKFRRLPEAENDKLTQYYQGDIKDDDTDIFAALKTIVCKQTEQSQTEFKHNQGTYRDFFDRLFEQEQKTGNDTDTDIDRYYILQALHTICDHYYGDQYFDPDGKRAPENRFELVRYLKKAFYFLWHEEKSEQSSEETFARFNSGKISLTNADLIKALLLRRENLLTDEEKKQYENGDADSKHRIENLLDIRRVETISEWDNMEQIMRSDDDRFWYFIADPQNMAKSSYFSRLELIFELEMLGDDDKNFLTDRHNTQYEIYRFFEKLNADKKAGRKTGDGDGKSEIWERVKKDFNTLREWYEEYAEYEDQPLPLYHYIGFLSCLDPNDFKGLKFTDKVDFPEEKSEIYWMDVLSRLLKASETMTKGEFENSVRTLIKDVVSRKINGKKSFRNVLKKDSFNLRECLDHLAYNFNDSDEDTDDKDEVVRDNELIKELLLLANMEELVKSKDQLEAEHKFPFKLWKMTAEDEGRKSEKLTLEHIQPQHPKLTAKNNAKVARDDLKKAYNESHKELMKIATEDIGKEIQNARKEISSEADDIDKMTDDQIRTLWNTEWQAALGKDPVRHPQRIYNLTLLQQRDNTALSNNWFFTKRNYILNTSQEKYFPLSTKHVFLKAYSREQPNKTDDGKSGESGAGGTNPSAGDLSQPRDPEQNKTEVKEYSLRLWEEKDARAYLDALVRLLEGFYESENDNQ